MGANRKPTAKRDATMGSNGIQKVTMGVPCMHNDPPHYVYRRDGKNETCVCFIYVLYTYTTENVLETRKRLTPSAAILERRTPLQSVLSSNS